MMASPEITPSHRYKEILENTGYNNPSLAPDIREMLVLRHKRAEMLQEIEAITGIRFDVVLDGVPTTTPDIEAGIDSVLGRSYVQEEAMDPEHPEVLLNKARKIKEMSTNSVSSTDTISNHLSYDHIQVLQSKLHISNLSNFELAEGFNDLIVNDRHGKTDNGLIVNDNLSIAMKLEELSLKETGVSLKKFFDSGDKALFFEKLHDLSQKLLVKRAVDKVLGVKKSALADHNLNPRKIEMQICERIDALSIKVDTHKQAETVIEKLLDEFIQMASIREFLKQRPANSNQEAEVA